MKPKETRGMKQLGEHKWVTIVATVALLFSVGAMAWSAVAWTEAKDDPDQSRIAARMNQREVVQPQAGAVTPPAGITQGGKGRQGIVQGLREEGIERLVAVLEKVRDEMSTEDQEQYDALVQAFKDQRASLQDATKGLAGTLKELRVLVAAYVGPNSGGTQ
jgi:hypothetical protein